jgi:hypothetical protein
MIPVINTKTHKKIKDVNVATRVTNKGKGKILQSVTTFVDSDQEFPLHGVRNNRRR